MHVVILSDGDTRLELSLIAHGETEHDTGDLYLSVAVQSLGFAGANGRVAIRCEQASRFLNELRTLERMRKGAAQLTSMTPQDLDLRIHVRDRAGHISAEGFLGRVRHSQTSAVVEVRIGFCIDIDPTSLAQLVSAFSELTGQLNNTGR